MFGGFFFGFFFFEGWILLFIHFRKRGGGELLAVFKSINPGTVLISLPRPRYCRCCHPKFRLSVGAVVPAMAGESVLWIQVHARSWVQQGQGVWVLAELLCRGRGLLTSAGRCSLQSQPPSRWRDMKGSPRPWAPPASACAEGG